MTNLIQDVKKEFPEFWELPIATGHSHYRKTEFDSINISLILEHLIDGSNKNLLLIVYPNDPTISFITVIEGLLSLLKRDLLAENSEVLSGVSIGDTVALINGRSTKPGIYQGIEKGSDGILRHIVKEDIRTSSSPVTHGIPFNLQWTIQPYRQAQTTKNKRQAELHGEKLEKILGLPPGGLLAFQKSKMLFVSKNKGQMKENLVAISLGEDPLTSVFSVADYVSEDSFNPIGSDPLRREPTCGLVTNTDVAVDVALRDPSIKLLVIEGASKINPHYGSLERLNNDTDQCKVICLLNSEDESEIKTLINLGAKAWVWKRSDFQKMGLNDSADKTDDVFCLHENILSYIGSPDPKMLIVKQPSVIVDALEHCFKLISQISKNTGDDLDGAILLRWSISLINSMLQLPLPLVEYHNYINTLENSAYLRLDTKLNSLQSKVKSSYGFSIPSDVEDAWEQLLNELWTIYKSLETSNPKWVELKNLIEKEGKEAPLLICFQEEYANALVTMHPDKFSGILSANEIGKTTEGHVLITGWKDRKSAAKLFLSPYKDCTYLLYPQENQRYSRTFQDHPSSPKSNIDNSLRQIRQVNSEDVIEDNLVGSTDINKLFDDIDQKFAGSLYKTHLQDYGEEDMTDVRRLIFEENIYTYVTENQGLNKLDREGKSIQKCHLEDIHSGDELVFADSERDMFEELLMIIQQSEQYKSLFSDAKLWHKALNDYITENAVSEDALSAQLSKVGCNVGLGTLRSWIKGALISPSENNLRDLAKVISNPKFNNSLESTIESSGKIHSLHIQTGRLLVRRIVNAVVQEDDGTIEEDTKNRIEEYSRKARIVSVREVSPETIRVPAKAIGKLFEL